MKKNKKMTCIFSERLLVFVDEGRKKISVGCTMGIR